MSLKQRERSPRNKLHWSTTLLLTVFLLGSLLPSLDRQVQAAGQQAAVLDVIINEVAWMGTTAFDGDEWLELYNPGLLDIDLNGWVLTNESGSFYLSFDATDTIPQNSYFLIERGSGNATSEIEQKTYSSNLLSDAGETLYLLDDSRQIIDTANYEGHDLAVNPWPSGSNSIPASMERTTVGTEDDSLWIINTGSIQNGTDAGGDIIQGTPGQPNSGVGLIQTPTTVPSLTPTPSPTSTPPNSMAVIINEVAWSGTANSEDDEWIELYNAGSAVINFDDGWRLASTDGTINIPLTGTLFDGDYYLLERKEYVTSSPSRLIYDDSIELPDGGIYLKLYAPGNVLVDTANNDGNSWPAGSGSPDFRSMERSGTVQDSATAWFTFDGVASTAYVDAAGTPINGTPGGKNWAVNVSATPSPVPTRTPILPSATPTPFPFQSVVLNEVLPRPGYDWNDDGVVNAHDEYIEIINRGSSSINLQGWKLDDEYELDSPPYTLPNVNLDPGQRIAIFGYTSHIKLSDGGDTVRLLKSNGQIADVITYTVIKAADQSWCRYPEDSYWRTDCFPTPNEENSLQGKSGDNLPTYTRPACSVPDTVPEIISFIECGDLGININDADFWNRDLPEIWLTGHAKNSTWFR